VLVDVAFAADAGVCCKPQKETVTKIIDTASITRGAWYVTVGRPSIHLSDPSFDSSSGVRRVCCQAPRGQEISTDSKRRRSSATASQHGAQQQMRAVSC